MDYSFLVPYTIEMNHHHPKGAGGTRDMFEVGWINDRAGPLTGQEAGDSELIDADGNTISTTCAAPANMRLSSPELSLTQQQEAIQVVSGSSSCDQQARQGKFDSRADFQRDKRNRKMARESASGDKGQKWRARARLVLEMISNGRLHFRMIPGAEHIHRGMWPLPTLDQLIHNLNPQFNGGKGLFDVKTREEVLEERSQRFALTLKTAEEVNNEAYLMKQPEESQKGDDDDEQMGEPGVDADWLKPSSPCHAFWTSETAACSLNVPGGPRQAQVTHDDLLPWRLQPVAELEDVSVRRSHRSVWHERWRLGHRQHSGGIHLHRKVVADRPPLVQAGPVRLRSADLRRGVRAGLEGLPAFAHALQGRQAPSRHRLRGGQDAHPPAGVCRGAQPQMLDQ